MAEGIQEAADAFARDIGGGSAPKSTPSGKPAERMFSNSDRIENPEDDPDGFEEAGDTAGEDGEFGGDEYTSNEPAGEDEEAGEGSDDEEEAEGSDEEDEEGKPGEGDLDLEALVEVQVDGKPKQVKLGEAIDGYIRMETFHQRLNELSEVKKQVIAEASNVLVERKKASTMLSQLEEQIKALRPTEPDWDKEFAADPANARILQKQYQDFDAILARVQKQREDNEAETQKQEGLRISKFKADEANKFVKIAGWDTKSKADIQRDVDSMRRTALASGFSDEEVGQVLDSRMLNILLKASKYDRMMANKPKAVNKVSKKPVTSGAGSNRTAPKKVAQAQRRLSRTGSLEDAAAVFQKLI